MARNFIQNKADVTKYYVNRAKKDEEKNQFKVVDTRRVKVPTRNGKSVLNQQIKMDSSNERSNQVERSSPLPPPPRPSSIPSIPPASVASASSTQVGNASSSSTTSTNNPQGGTIPDYRFLLAWSYYLASQAAWISPMLQQQGHSPFTLPSDPESAAKFLKVMETAMNPLTGKQTLNNNHEQNKNEHESGTKISSSTVKNEPNDS